MDPLRLTRFFDQAAPRSPANMSRLQQDYGYLDEESYYPPRQARPFAKFSEGKTRVVQLEQTAVGGVFGQPATRVTVVPVREEDEIVQGFAARASDSRQSRRSLRSASGRRVMNGNDARRASARPGTTGSGSRRVRALPPNEFRVNHVRQPVVGDEPVAPHRDGVMLPSQRRKAIEQEVRIQRAAKLARKARNNKQRMLDLMRTRHPVGVVGMDSPAAEDTLAYHDAARATQSLSQTQSFKRTKRAQYLAAKRSPRAMRNYDFIAHKATAPQPHERTGNIFQGKGRAGYAVDTYERMFKPATPERDNVERRVHIRNQLTQGRRFDIVTGTDLPYVPPSRPENKHTRLAHPSLIATGYPLQR